MRKKIILFVLLFAWLGLIFYFSSQPSDESSILSGKALDLIINIIEKIFNYKFSADKLNYISVNFLVPLRKLAHFTLYFILGIITYFLNKCFFHERKTICFTLLICVLYAISDEFHQLFVPGRACEFKDIMLDSFGSAVGSLLIKLIERITLYNKFHNKNEVYKCEK